MVGGAVEIAHRSFVRLLNLLMGYNSNWCLVFAVWLSQPDAMHRTNKHRIWLTRYSQSTVHQKVYKSIYKDTDQLLVCLVLW
jgi:hypothetical protein